MTEQQEAAADFAAAFCSIIGKFAKWRTIDKKARKMRVKQTDGD